MMNTSKETPETILIVDDNPEYLSILEMMLTQQDYLVHTALSGELALQTIDKILPDLILLDVMMSGMDGYTLSRQLKANKQYKDIPILFISSLDSTEDKVIAFEAGGQDFITKPFQVVEVLARVRTHLELQRTKNILVTAFREKEETNYLMESILSSVQDTIITVDENQCIINSNRKLRKSCCFSINNGSTSAVKNGTDSCPGVCIDAILQTATSRKSPKKQILEVDCSQNGLRTLVLNIVPLKDPGNRFSGAVLSVRDITRQAQLEKELIERSSFRNIIGKSKEMQQVFSLLEQVSDVLINALVFGESGTGKELIAEALHYGSARASKPLIKVNCAALSENLLESELFGHIRGAFTGAVKDQKGRIQAAQGGTLFLDEIGDISHRLQLRLLRFLENKEFERVGESITRKADVRVVAATNRDLLEKVRQGTFREDLYYRLIGIIIKLPPLRSRLEDVPLLCEYFIKHFGDSQHKHIAGLSESARVKLYSYSWPGNVRELKNTMEYSCAVCNDELIHYEHLPPYLGESSTKESTQTKPESISKESEKDAILEMLTKFDNNRAKAARSLGMARSTFYNKLKQYDIR